MLHHYISVHIWKRLFSPTKCIIKLKKLKENESGVYNVIEKCFFFYLTSCTSWTSSSTDFKESWELWEENMVCNLWFSFCKVVTTFSISWSRSSISCLSTFKRSRSNSSSKLNLDLSGELVSESEEWSKKWYYISIYISHSLKNLKLITKFKK